MNVNDKPREQVLTFVCTYLSTRRSFTEERSEETRVDIDNCSTIL